MSCIYILTKKPPFGGVGEGGTLFRGKRNQRTNKAGGWFDDLAKTELGFKVIIDNKYPALVYGDQVFNTFTGDRMKGYIATGRPDGKIDCTLITRAAVCKDFARSASAYLKDNGGVCNLGDKSDAEDVKRLFKVSIESLQRKPSATLYKRSSHYGWTTCNPPCVMPYGITVGGTASEGNVRADLSFSYRPQSKLYISSF